MTGPRLTRRGLTVALGVLWLLDGLLQAQPFMFRAGFASQVLDAAAAGQPGWVAGGVHWAAGLVGAQPALWNAVFVVAQLALGAGLLIRPLARVALGASVGWSLLVWYFGEGLGGLASGHASLISGAPGAVLLYAVLAAIAWPRSTVELTPWTPVAWAVLWIGGAVFQALPGQHGADDVADSLNSGMVSWLSPAGGAIADGVRALGVAAVVILLVLLVGVGLGGLVSGWPRRVAGWAGIVLALGFWVFGQGFGMLTSGQATDPSTGPLIVLLAVVLLSLQPAAEAGTEAEPGWRVPTPVLSGVSALAVVGVALIWWATSLAPVPTPPPSLTVSTVYTPAGNGPTAPVYFTITNSGAGTDTLDSAGTEFQTANTAKSVAVCAATDCPAKVTIPAHGTIVFDASGPHLLVSGMGALSVGHQPLQLTLKFARSGVLHVLSPIGSAADLTENDIMTYGFMGGASPGMGMDEPGSGMPGATGMPGMTMPGG